MAKRRCAYCGAGDLTSEHGWPEWLDKHTPDAINISTKILSSSHPPIEREWRKQVSGNKVAFFCRDCNCGWMSDIERAADRIIGPMIRGKGTALTKGDQEIIATWLVNRSLVRMFTTPVRHEQYFADVFRAFFETRRPLPNHQILIGAYKLEGDMVFCGHAYGSGPTPTRVPTSYLCTIGVGHFVGQVFYSPHQAKLSTDDYWQRIAPFEREFIWPPGPFVAEATLKKTNRSFFGPLKSS